MMKYAIFLCVFWGARGGAKLRRGRHKKENLYVDWFEMWWKGWQSYCKRKYSNEVKKLME